MSQNVSTYPFGGGLDTNSAALAVPPSYLIGAMNYEPLAEGYARVQGHERFDGQTAPSKAKFTTLPFAAGSSPIAQGDTVTGVTSGATGIVITAPLGFAGGWDAGTAAATLLLGKTTGTFQSGEPLSVGGVNRAVADGPPLANAAETEALRREYDILAREWQRTRIGRVPGEGPVRGVAVHDGEVFAWRDRTGGDFLEVYRATGNGWQALAGVYRMTIVQGSIFPPLGATITGSVSGATASIINFVERPGSDFSLGTGRGFIDVVNLSGTFVEETIVIDGASAFKGREPSIQRTSAGGRVRTISHNFYGASDRYRLYGATGSGRAFELLPEGVAPIITGMVPDFPQRIFEIGNHLGLTFPGGSIQFSGIGDPHTYEVLLGAGEIGFGTDITDVVQANETAVAIFGESKIAVLQGNDAENFVLDTLTEEAGAEPDTAQRISRTMYLDRRGLRSLDATQAFGNFKTGTLSGQFERYFRVKRKAGAEPIGSYVCKAKSQYRLMWDDGTGLTVYMGDKKPSALPFSVGDMRPFCFGGGEVEDGEALFAGGEDGYVYRLDSGDSFDGEKIKAFAITPFNHFGNPQMDNRFHKVTLELEAPAIARIGITVQFDYGDGYQPVAGDQNFTVMGGPSDFLIAGGGGLWGSAIWDQMYWSAPVESRAEAYVEGIGRNASFIFATEAALDEPSHTLQAYLVHTTPRKMRR